MQKLSKLELVDVRNSFLFADFCLQEFNQQEHEDDLKDLKKLKQYINDGIIAINDSMSYAFGAGWTAKSPQELVKIKDTLFDNEKFICESAQFGIPLSDIEESYLYRFLCDYIDFSKMLWSEGTHYLLKQPVKNKAKISEKFEKILKKYFTPLENKIGFKNWDRSPETSEFSKQKIRNIAINCDAMFLCERLQELSPNQFINLNNSTKPFVTQIIASRLLLLNNLYIRQYKYIHDEKYYSLFIEEMFLSSIKYLINIACNKSIKDNLIKYAKANMWEYEEKNKIQHEYSKPKNFDTSYNYINAFILKAFKCFGAYRNDFFKQITKKLFDIKNLEPSNQINPYQL